MLAVLAWAPEASAQVSTLAYPLDRPAGTVMIGRCPDTRRRDRDEAGSHHRRVLLLIVAGSGRPGFAQDATLFQQPTVNGTHIVFVYAGDLWIVPREGGDAQRLTAGVGEETDPYFSPDGSMVAFSGAYDGNRDVFVVPARGGVPKRLTYHPGADTAVGWTKDGTRVLFSSSRESYVNIFLRLYTVDLSGGFPTPVPLPMAERGSVLARRPVAGLRTAGAVAAGLEAVPWRPAGRNLDRQALRLCR